MSRESGVLEARVCGSQLPQPQGRPCPPPRSPPHTLCLEAGLFQGHGAALVELGRIRPLRNAFKG